MNKNRIRLSAIAKISILIIWALLIIFLMFMGVNWLIVLIMIFISPVVVASVLLRPSTKQAQTINSSTNNNSFSAEMKIRRYGIISLVIGVFTALCWLPFGPWNGSAGGLILAIFIPFIIAANITCIVLLVLVVKTRKLHPYNFRKYCVMSVAGLILSLSLWIFSLISGIVLASINLSD